MNNDLISREALKEVITKNHYLLSARNNSTDYGMFTTGIMQAIDNASTVCGNNPKWCENCVSKGKCASTRPQGEWIRTGSLGNGNAQYECSHCHYGDEHAESQEVPYCWHCGADMRGGRQ